MRLPQSYRDAGFQRRIAELERAEQLGGRNEVWQALLAAPWVTDHPFRPDHATHCPHGHSSGDHLIGDPAESYQGRECRRRQCQTCGSQWLEPVETT